MAYADQQMSSNRVIAIVIVALIHIALGYLLVTGLAVSAFQEVVERVTTVDVEEPPPPPEPEDEPPPPPPEQEVPQVTPPPVVPQPKINPKPNPVFQTTTTDLTERPQTQTVSTKSCPGGQVVLSNQNCPEATKTCPNGSTVAVSASCPVPSKARGASPDGQGRWAARIQGDYPSSALRREEQGTVSMRITVGANGRVEACTVTGSSGSSALDDAACRGMQRYARYNPALNDAGNPISSTTSQSIRYVLPD